jgi:putative PEP-CTERM system TPR-repeat lipoprotein
MSPPRSLRAGALALALTFCAAACSTHLSDAEYVERGLRYQADGKLQSAVIEFKNALQQNVDNKEARLHLGEVYSALNLGQDAQEQLERARELGVDPAVIKVPLARALVAQGLYARALEEAAVAADTPAAEVPKLLELQGRAELGQLHFDRGCKLFADARDKDARYVPAWWGIARCAMVQGKFDEASAALDQASALDAKNADTWVLKGDVARARRQPQDAEAAYSKALELEAGKADALLGRATARIERNDFAAARQDVDAAAAQAKNHPLVHLLRGVLQFRERKYADAATNFEHSLQASPGYPPAVLWLGLTSLMQGNNERAAAQFDEYLRGRPGATDVRAFQALAMARSGRGSEARDALAALRNVNVDDPQALAVLAQAHLGIGDPGTAAAYMAKAVESQPGAAQLRVDFAQVLLSQGERDKAIEQLEDAVQIDPQLTTADTLLVQNLIRDNQLDKAMQAVEALERKKPDDPIAYNLKGAVYLRLKDNANARKSFERALALETRTHAAAMNLAQLDLVEGHPQVAQKRFEKILQQDPASQQAMIGLAGIAAATGKEADYVRWLEQAMKDARAVRPRLMLARYWLQKKDGAKALPLARAAAALAPNEPAVLDALGTALLMVGQAQEGVATYEQLARRLAGNAAAQYRLATAYAAANDVIGARRAVTRALALEPDHLGSLVLLGSIEMSATRFQDAAKIAQQIEAKYPKSASGYGLEGNALMGQKQYAAALKAYEKAFALNQTGLLVVQIHAALDGAGRRAEGDARVAQWLRDHPDDVSVVGYLAGLKLKDRQYADAARQYERLVALDPRNARYHSDLAWLYQKTGDGRALPMAEKAYSLAPDNPDVTDTLGWILVDQGKLPRAVDLLQKAASRSTSAEIRYHLAFALAKAGDKQRARGELEELLASQPSFPQRDDAIELLKQL